ncbi:MAG TPA: ABC transporter ATP-binding protein [Dongiaceae bacterium]|nr:ABC transporter ATP-binding protein [Dongiaceae bacterium]
MASAVEPLQQDPPSGTNTALLEVSNLVVEFRQGGRSLRAANQVSLSVRQGETMGIVGESGSGKSVLCRTILRLLPTPPAFVRSGSVRFGDVDLLTLTEERMREVRGADIAMVFQNPMNALNPVWPIGDQVSEGLRVHKGLGQRAARDRAIELLKQVGIPSPELRVDEYPHQWSGGMVQRAVIAMAMANQPKLILADEPTTALDVTIQDQILALLMDLQHAAGMSLVLVSHDMAVVAETCDRVAVMYAGRIVELADTRTIFRDTRHPYTLGLMQSIPRIDAKGERLEPIQGAPPNLSTLPPGCPFAPRCRFVQPECRAIDVTLREISPGHFSACLFPERVDGSMS